MSSSEDLSQADKEKNLLSEGQDGLALSHEQPKKKGREKKVYVCPVAECGRVCSRKSSLEAHMHLHYGTQPFKCSFAGCDKMFSEK